MQPPLHGSPDGSGAKRMRSLPAHSSVAVIVRAGSARNSAMLFTVTVGHRKTKLLRVFDTHKISSFSAAFAEPKHYNPRT